MVITTSMSRHMRTTVRLDDALLELARREGERRGVTLTALIAEGLRLVLARGSSPGSRRTKVTLPVSREGGGTRPGINLDDSAALLDAMEEPS
jgi:hypothetical protein